MLVENSYYFQGYTKEEKRCQKGKNNFGLMHILETRQGTSFMYVKVEINEQCETVEL